MMLTARADGTIAELKVRRGSVVKQGDVIAVLSDEAREAQVLQARAMVMQRKTELEAKMKLIEQGTMPKLEAVNLEAQFKAAEAALAAAEAERDRGVVRAPWAGIVNDVPVEVGRRVLQMMGKEIAQIVALDPMLAVVEVAERKLAGVQVGDAAEIRLVTGQTARARSASSRRPRAPTTRTYRVEVEVDNADGAIPDGITAEVAIPLAPVAGDARAALGADLLVGGRSRRAHRRRATARSRSCRSSVVEDEQEVMWVAGIADGARVIVQGQDFVREGQQVEAVGVGEAPKTAAR